jgi:hypothetical protein
MTDMCALALWAVVEHEAEGYAHGSQDECARDGEDLHPLPACGGSPVGRRRIVSDRLQPLKAISLQDGRPHRGDLPPPQRGGRSRTSDHGVTGTAEPSAPRRRDSQGSTRRTCSAYNSTDSTSKSAIWSESSTPSWTSR